MRLAVLAGLMIFASTVHAVGSGPIDRIFMAKGDITGEGLQDQLVMHVSSRSMTSPFTWTLVIKDPQGHVLLDLKTDDSHSDAFFGQRGYEEDCSDYVSCKQRYYFDDLPKAVFACLRPAKSGAGPASPGDIAMQQVAAEFLAERKISPVMQRAAIAEMQRTLSRPSVPILTVPMSPVQSGPPMIWVRTVHLFVPIYQE